MSRALTLADVLEEVQRQGADPGAVRIRASGQLLSVDDEWWTDRPDGGLVVGFGYEPEYDEDCDCVECPDPGAHAKAAKE